MSRVLSRYVARATLGLPRRDRVELAAELRTHLMDRVRQLEAEGFSREEAEHLAVKGMGNVRTTNRQLLGHLFTTPLGWAVVGTLVVGGGGWWVWQNVPLPLPALRQASWTWRPELDTADLRRIATDQNAPRGQYLAGTLRLPRETRWVYFAVTPLRDGPGFSHLWANEVDPGKRSSGANTSSSTRVLLGGDAWTTTTCGGTPVRPQLSLYVSQEPWTSSSPADGLPFSPLCTRVAVPEKAQLGGWSGQWQKTAWEVTGAVSDSHPSARPLPMNQWTPVALFNLNYWRKEEPLPFITSTSDGSRMKAAFLYSVFPADHKVHDPDEVNPAPNLGIISDDRIGFQRSGLNLPWPTLNMP